MTAAFILIGVLVVLLLSLAALAFASYRSSQTGQEPPAVLRWLGENQAAQSLHNAINAIPGALRNPWEKEDQDLEELARLVGEIKDSEKKSE